MNQNYKIDHTMLLELTLCRAEDETLDYILEGMASCFQNNMPCEEEVKRYLSCPERQSSLTASQRIIAMDKLLEYAEICFRTTCDMLRYKLMRDAGMVNTVDEFLQLLRPEGRD